MTEPTPTPTATAEVTADPAETPEPQPEGAEQQPDAEAAERTARRDREKLARARAQAAETERDTAIGERDTIRAERDSALAALESLQRHAIEFHVNPKILGHQAFWKLNDNVADLLDGAGNPDPRAIAKAVEGTRVQLGLEPQPTVKRQMGMRLGVGAQPDGRTQDIADGFRRRDN